MRVKAAVVSALLVTLSGSASPQAAGCDPTGGIRFVCDQSGPEDLVAVPGTSWVIASGMASNGGVRLIDARALTSTMLFPSSRAKERPDNGTYATCPGPLDAAGQAAFKAHGLYLLPRQGGLFTLFVVHHGSRESIEVFELDARGATPLLTWTGCVVAPDPIGLNSVVGFADGGFITTNFMARGVDAAARARVMQGEKNGELWEWRPGGAWQKVPGTEAAGPNGVEISKDGRWLFLANWGSQTLVRMPRGRQAGATDTVSLGFRVDNLRWAPDGSLVAAGQGGAAPDQASVVVRIDPQSLKVTELLRHPYGDVFAFGTGAIQLGTDLWVGSARGEKIGVFPLGAKAR
jgi:sugar lactone lactonase YvrE